ncbi:MAG: hypothetical protein HY819_17895 [Acidobacteria bacterium]|nr:hypothetical protein [Acidobacteriota bacterium]
MSTVSKDNTEENNIESILTAPQAVEKRLEKNIIISIILFVLFAFLFGTKRFAFGVTIGTILSYINYRWLYSSLKSILLDVTQGQEAPKGLGAVRRFIFRWLLIFLTLLTSASLSGRELTLGITIGLLSFVGAVMLEAITQISSVLFQK